VETDEQRTDGEGRVGAVAGLAGWGLVTMAIVPVLALTVGAYLGATGRYLAAIVIVAAAGGVGWWLYQRRHRRTRQADAESAAGDVQAAGLDGTPPPMNRTKRPSPTGRR
jgi:hypothetical protein